MLMRSCAYQDLDELVEVAARVRARDDYPVYLADGDFRSFLTRPPALASWVVEIDDRVVAHVALHSESHHSAMEVIRAYGISGELGVIARLLVDPGERRRGLGTRLLERARNEAVTLGRTPVLDVATTARGAVELYRAGGWREIGRTRFDRPDGPPVEEIVFATLR